MRNANLNTAGILNASVQLTLRAASPWMGVLWITALPLRLLQVYFAFQLLLLSEPQFYLYYLWRLSTLVFAAFIVSLYGRAVYVRACYYAGNSAVESKFEALKVPLSDFIPYVYTALINEFFFYLTLFTIVMWPPFIVYGGLAAATSYGIGGPKMIGAPLNAFKISWTSFWALAGISLVFFFGMIMALINLYFLIVIALKLGGGILGSALPRWEYIFEPGPLGLLPKQPLTYALLVVGASLIVEPFWLAANVDLVQRVRARKSGEDLQLWFQEIKKEAAQ